MAVSIVNPFILGGGGGGGGSFPQVLGYTEAALGNSASLDITAPTTAASDLILLLVSHRNGGVSITPPANFTALYNSGNAIAAFKWDGTGTRPNANTQTITFGASESVAAQMLAISSADVAYLGVTADAAASEIVSPAVSTTNANALVLHMFRHRRTSLTTLFSGTTPDETAFSTPDTEGQEEIEAQNDHWQLVQTIEQATAGAVNRMTSDSTVFGSALTLEIY